MFKRILTLFPLIFFMALVITSGYFILQDLTPSGVAAVAPTKRPTMRPTASPTPVIDTPTSTSTSTPTASPTPTETATPTRLPVVEPTPLPTPTPNPVTIVWVQSDSSNPLDPTHRLGIRAPDLENPVLQDYVAAPALAPDDSKLAFFAESSLSGFDTGIWVVDVASGVIDNPMLLTGVTDVQNMAWSPDGDKLAFEVIINPFDPPEEWRSQVRVVRANPEDGYVELSVFDGRQPAWSPDSQRLVVQSCKGSECGLYLVNCGGGNCDYENAEQITSDISDSFPAWSVDDAIAFTSKQDDNQDVYLYRLADGSLQNLTNRPSTDITPLFSPDGQKIYFRTDFPDGANWQIQVMTLDNNGQGAPEISTVLADVGGDDQSWGLVRPAVR